jgi:hypothetical protein
LHWHGHCACVPYHAPHQLGGVELDKWQRRHPRTLTLLLPSTIHLRNDAYSDGDGDRLLDGDWSKLIRGLSIRKERNRRRRNSQTFHRLPALPPHMVLAHTRCSFFTLHLCLNICGQLGILQHQGATPSVWCRVPKASLHIARTSKNERRWGDDKPSSIKYLLA